MKHAHRTTRAPHPAAPAAAARGAADLAHLMQRVYAVVLAGGRGSRLFQLTDRRSKPAVYFGGNWRIIDFTLSNCLNSNLKKIGVLTQYEAHSLLRHLQHAWSFLPRDRGQFVDMLPARQQIDEVARRFGFGSAERLRRTFRRHLSVTPSRFRQNFQTTGIA